MKQVLLNSLPNASTPIPIIYKTLLYTLQAKGRKGSGRVVNFLWLVNQLIICQLVTSYNGWKPLKSVGGGITLLQGKRQGHFMRIFDFFQN